MGLNASQDRDTLHFSDLTSSVTKAFILEFKMKRRFDIVTQEGISLFFHKIVPKNTEKKTSHASKNKLFQDIFPCDASCKNV